MFNSYFCAKPFIIDTNYQFSEIQLADTQSRTKYTFLSKIYNEKRCVCRKIHLIIIYIRRLHASLQTSKFNMRTHCVEFFVSR